MVEGHDLLGDVGLKSLQEEATLALGSRSMRRDAVAMLSRDEVHN